MSSKWPSKSLRELGITLIDCIHKTPKGVDEGYPYVGIPQMKNGELDFNAKTRLISESDYKTWTEKVKPQHQDIVLSRRCNPGETAYVSERNDFALGQNLVLLRPDKSKLHPGYLRWVVKSAYWWEEVERYRNPGAVFDSLKCADIPKFEIPNPPIDVQCNIDKILKSLSDKTLLNNSVNLVLEQIAQTIFKSWFVDFEPTKAKIDAREALLSENPAAPLEQIATAEQQAAIQAIAGAGDIIPTEQLQNIADLFPNQMVDSDLGEMPEGWEVCISGELIDVRDGTHDSPKKAESGYPLVTSKHITSGVLKLEDTYLISEEDFEKVNKRSAVKTGDILLTMIGTVGIPYLVLDREVNFAIKNVGLFRTSKSKNHQFYFYLLLKTQMMQDYLEARMAGTTQKYLSLKVLRNLEFISPPLDSVLLSHFNLLITPIMNLIQQNSQQTYSLAELRDSLLPKLLSGEISFEDKDID